MKRFSRAAVILAAAISAASAAAQSLLDAIPVAPEPDPVLSGRRATPAPPAAAPEAQPAKHAHAPAAAKPAQPAPAPAAVLQAAAPAAATVAGKKKGDKSKNRGGGMFGLGDSSKKRTPGRDSIITSERTDYDRKNGIILFDRNVFVDDEMFKMHSDRLWVFLNASNELSRIVAIGNVAFTNDMKSAKCTRATYSKDKGRVVLFGESDAAPAVLSDRTEKGEMTVRGRKITYYPETDLVSVEGPVLTAPASAFDADKKRKDILRRGGGNAPSGGKAK